MTRQGLFDNQDHLPHILSVMDVLVSGCGLRKRKCLGNHGLDPPLAIEAEEFIEFAAQQGATGKQSSEIDADNGNVLAHQFERMKPRGLNQGGEAAQPTPFPCRPDCRRKSVYYEAARRTETLVAAR